MAEATTVDAATVAEVNRLIDYHGPISLALTEERTSLESALIPVTAYIVVACAEAFLRYPDLMARIEAAMPAEEIGRRGRRPGSQVNTVYLWSIANFWLLGRKIVSAVDPTRDEFWGSRTFGSGPVTNQSRIIDSMDFRAGSIARSITRLADYPEAPRPCSHHSPPPDSAPSASLR